MNRYRGLLGPQNGSDLPSALGLVFVVLLRRCVLLCLFVVLLYCVQSRKPGVTMCELPDPTHSENKPIGRRCALYYLKRERD